MSTKPTGVVIESGLQNWQIIQQDRRGRGAVQLCGRWRTADAFKKVEVIVRVVEEATLQPVTRALEWRPATTVRDGTWRMPLRDIPAGGLYRIKTALRLDNGPVEWARRGDLRLTSAWAMCG